MESKIDYMRSLPHGVLQKYLWALFLFKEIFAIFYEVGLNRLYGKPF